MKMKSAARSLISTNIINQMVLEEFQEELNVR
jgi:hypothetical protein